LRKSRRSIRQAVLLAGGEGRRLRPYTKVLPKPLWPVGDVPIVEILIRQLAAAGIREIIMAVGYQAELIRVILGDGRQFGVKIRYSHEKKPLGTAAPLKKIKGLDDSFLVLNGDLLTNLPFKEFAQYHLKNKSAATVAVSRRSVKVDFGVVIPDQEQIGEYLEKPVLKYLVSTGIYAFDSRILRHIPRSHFDFPDLVVRLIEAGLNPEMYYFRGRWLDIGRHDDWEKADRLFRRNPRNFLQ